MKRQNRNYFQKIQDGDHFRFLNNSAIMRPKQKLIKKSVPNYETRPKLFSKNSKMSATFGFSISRQLCDVEKINFKQKVLQMSRLDRNCFHKS
jgi:hypothetical protein